MINKKESLYIPSFTIGALGAGLEKDWKLPDGSPLRFWDNAFEKKYQHHAILLTAGHKYKVIDYSKKFSFPDDMLIFGDSGGFQIATGALKFSQKLTEEIFKLVEI